ncbi:MAG TPA: SMC-Scp complex subunit ScpB [Candidatus Paceibacterota bacterium]
MDTNLASKIEALLFAQGSMSKKELGEHLKVSVEEIDAACAQMQKEQSGRGIVCVDDGKNLELRAAPSASTLIEAIRKEEYNRDIGKAGLEVLAAVLYRGAQTRAQIDFIRGVNSSQTLRTLTMRGLLRKITNPKDERSYLYEPTVELLSHLSITNMNELPEYEHIKAQLAALESQPQTSTENNQETVTEAAEEAENM